MTTPKTRKSPGPRRTPAGLVLVKIRNLDREGKTARGKRTNQARVIVQALGVPTIPGSHLWRFSAQTVGAWHIAYGSTPREACDALGKRLTALSIPFTDMAAADPESDELLSTRYKRAGQDLGGAPLKREERASAVFTFRLPERLKTQLVGTAERDGVSPAQMAIDALEAYFADKPKTSRARRSTQ